MYSKSQFRPRHVFRVALSALVLISAGSAATASVATASSRYEVFYCQKPDGSPASMTDWHASLMADGDVSNSCPSEYDLHLGRQQHSSGEQSVLGMNAPDGVTLSSMRVYRSASILPSSTADVNASPDFFSVYGPTSTITGDGCAWFQTSPWDGNAPCRGVSWAGYAPGPPSVDLYFPDTDRFAFVVGCGGAGTCGASSPTNESRVTLAIHSIAVIATDNAVPQPGPAGGTLLGAGALKGTQTLTYTPSDMGSGIYSSIVFVDRAFVEQLRPDRGSCADVTPETPTIEFDQIQPCPTTASFRHTIDTTRLADGVHRAVVVLRDAAGNESVAADTTFTVDNIPPPSAIIGPSISGGTPTGGLRPGDALVVADGTWNGASIAFTHRWQRQNDAGAWIDIANATSAKYTVTSDDVGHALRALVWGANSDGTTMAATEPTGAVRSGATVQTQSVAPTPTLTPTPTATPVSGAEPAPVAAAAATNGAGGDTASGQLVLDREQKSIDVNYGAKIVITGRLVDANNEPIANADVDVFEQLVTTTASWNKIGTIHTDSQGGYLFRPNTTASRRLRFAWSNKIGTSDYRATREVLLSVTAGMSIKAQHRVVGRHATIKISGRVTIAGLPATGQWVEVQVLDAGVWRTVATRKLSSKGGWTFKHHLGNSSRITFAFRSRLRASGEIAAVESKSAPVKVRVR